MESRGLKGEKMRRLMSGMLLATFCAATAIATSAAAQGAAAGPSWQVVRPPPPNNNLIWAEINGAGRFEYVMFLCSSTTPGDHRLIVSAPGQRGDTLDLNLFGSGGRFTAFKFPRIGGTRFGGDAAPERTFNLLTGPDTQLLMQIDGEPTSGYLSLKGASAAIRTALAKCLPGRPPG